MSQKLHHYFGQKTIWVTGASSGLGKAMALKAAEQGARVIVSGRNLKALQQIQKVHPDKIRILDFDVSDIEQRKKALEKVTSHVSNIDIFIYSAGLSQRSWAQETELSTVQDIMEVNFFGAVHLSAELLKQGLVRSGGQLVILSSVTGYVSTPKRSTYAASKHALHGYFNTLRGELHGKNIAITLLCPGYVNTGIDTRSITADGSMQAKPDANRPVGLTPEKFADKAMLAISKRKEEAYIGGIEVMAIYLQRFFPWLNSMLSHRFEPKVNADL